MEPVCDAFYPIDGIYEELSVSLKRKVDNTQNVTTTEVMSISELDWSDYMLVLPSVSFGNVGQMAVDLLISTFPVKKVGYMEHEALLPIVGADPYTNSSQLSTSCEVYVAVEKQLVIIQQRSPFVKRKKSDYLKQLRSWIKLWNFRNVVMLSSLNAFYRNDAQLLGSQYRYICNKHSENQCEQQLSANGWKQLELRKDYADHPNDTFYMPGGGITKLFMNLCNEGDVPLVVLFVFCSEGDNTGDAFGLVDQLNQWLQLVDKPNLWSIPPSWRLLFGRPVPQLF
ncbi:PREDICTED: proteasome assembly chaperone 2-like isoform X2 [Priapulus caudatus]|uniref:Proteasome assembly chaperone 2 n=1 Tax=Priapulus caudatus TaxID=37621 RepID=A0ABM1F962_PRICU|nr:PREDICTED: proteasome assembly chaperone 2-like isoform X2 [Priapulus caudatus]